MLIMADFQIATILTHFSGYHIIAFVPRVNNEIGSKAFSVVAPTLWNSLEQASVNVRSVETVNGSF